MKTFRKNVDLSAETVAILQIEGTLKDYGSLKPFLESILNEFAAKCAKSRPKIYQAVVQKKIQKISKRK